MTGRVVQVSVSAGGVPKSAVDSAKVTTLGLAGDRHRDLEHHGGPERAVCIFALEAIEALKAEGHPVVPGGLGENLTIAGIDWSSMVPDAVLKVGDDLMLQVMRYTSPCVNITRSFLHGDYSRVSQKRHPGWSRVYARVLVPGSVSTGDAVRLLSEAEARPIVGSLRL
ncbi:MAG: MOSC domain-containing protein [Candidatus Rokuibacteriota bacterium]|nr:MAG: MOSC domain-containing protein [Candidatus Rokubacteria bacterium]